MPPSDPGSNGNDRDVLTSLPRTRPTRRSAKRDRPARGAAPADAAAAAASAPSDTPARAKAKAAANAKPAGQRPKRAAASSKAKASSRAKPAAASGKRPARTTGARAGTTTATANEPAVPPAGYATSAPERRGPDPFALVSTTVQAAGEIAQIGATLWTQAVRSAINRLPKP